MSVKSPSWKITDMKDCKKILSKGVAEGMTDVIWGSQKGYEMVKGDF